MQRQVTGNSFIFSIAEFSGALADLGVMLPLILAPIASTAWTPPPNVRVSRPSS